MKNNIRVQRAIKDISQEKMANDLKIHRTTVFAIENNKYMPSGLLMIKIARYFGKTVEEIFEIEEGD